MNSSPVANVTRDFFSYQVEQPMIQRRFHYDRIVNVLSRKAPERSQHRDNVACRRGHSENPLPTANSRAMTALPGRCGPPNSRIRFIFTRFCRHFEPRSL